MNNKNVILTILGGIGVAAAIICWLLFGGSAPKNVELGEGVKELVEFLKEDEKEKQK